MFLEKQNFLEFILVLHVLLYGKSKISVIKDELDDST